MVVEWWAPVVAPLIVDFCKCFGASAFTCLGNVCCCLCGKVDNKRDLDDNLGLLRTALTELERVRKVVEIKVNDGVRKGGKTEAEVARWISKVSAFETDTDQLLADADEGGLSTSGCWSTDSFSKCCLGEKVFKKLNEARELTRRGNNYYSASKQDCPVVEEKFFETTIFGLETAVDKAWENIRKDKNKLVGIYGMGGVGKTTLLARINNKFLEVEDEYDIVIWVKVSKAADVGKTQDDEEKKTEVAVKRIQDKIGKRLHLCNEEWSTYTKAERKKKIRETLSEQKPKFVLLLDDLWKDVSLTEIGLPLLRTEQYRVVFTTRSEAVCGLMRANDKIKVELLGETDATGLFNETANSSGLSNEISDVAKKIVAECNGLPLALKVTGRAMASKTDLEAWNRALQDLKFYPGELKENEKIYKVLKLSLDNLEKDDARCFQYCALFPKAYNIKRDELVEYWIGEGFLT